MRKQKLIALFVLWMTLLNVSFSQESSQKIKYPFLLYSERGKEWVYTPEQTDRIIRKIESERVLVEKLRIGAERRDSLIQELQFKNSKTKELYETQIQITKEVTDKFNLAAKNYENMHAINLQLEKDLIKEKKAKNRYKTVVIGGVAALTTYLIISLNK